MKIDLAKVESQIRRLEELKRIASDPELLSLLETVMVNGSSPRPDKVSALAEYRPTAIGPPLARKQTSKKGELQAAVRATLANFEKPFSGYTVARKMQNDGYQFASSRPGIAVIDALKALGKKGVVRVFKLGSGSEATLFERVQEARK